jgi:hypothetical protein
VKVQANQEGLKLNGTDQIWACADNDNLPSYNIHTTQKNAEAMFIAGKETISK